MDWNPPYYLMNQQKSCCISEQCVTIDTEGRSPNDCHNVAVRFSGIRETQTNKPWHIFSLHAF
jgi:hypothetical protein